MKFTTKLLSLLLAIAMLFSITAGINLSAYAAISGDYEYEILDDGTVAITKYNGSASKLTIPSAIDGKKVAIIGMSAFYDCTCLTNVTIPNSVKCIGYDAFSKCASLTSVTIPNSVTIIEDSAFSWCKSLTNVIIPNCVTSIGKNVFSDCTSLKSVKIPNSVKSIGYGAFSDCASLTSVAIPNSVTSIEAYAFYGCESLTSVAIPNSVTTVDASTFSNCKSLISVTIPNSVTSIDHGAFSNCISLTSVTIPNSVISIGSTVFSDCESLTSVTIPNSVKSIGWNAFWGCKSLTSVTIPNSVTSIGDEAFWGCKSITILNKNCKLGFEAIDFSAAIYGYKGSTAEAYAKTNGNKFVALSETGKLATPTLKVTVNANGTFTLSWNKIANADKYDLYIKQPNGSYKVMKTTTATSFVTAVGAYGYSYSYKMKAINSSASSDFSNVVNATNTKKLETPKMKAAVNANGTFTLSWGEVTGADKYELYIKQPDGSFKVMKTTTATSFITAVGTYGYTYSYKMRAVNSKNSSLTSAYSSVVNAKNTKKLETPKMKAAVNANGTFKLTWNKVAGADKYELYIKQPNGSYKVMKTTTATSFTTAVGTYGYSYSYKMRAVNSKNSSLTSAYSSVVNAKNTKKLQTPTMKVAINKNGSFKLSWNAVAGATSYKLYIKQANGSYKVMKTTTATSFTTAVGDKGKTYSYKMVAVTSKNSSAASAYSNVVTAKRK